VQFSANPLLIPSFNPCSLGCCSESNIGARASGALIDVSILVLLDVALKEGTIASVQRYFKGFNPCSLGCCSESVKLAVGGIVSFGFNPCSLGCCSESRPASTTGPASSSSCFNPCSLGCCSESLFTGYQGFDGLLVSILVLLDVALKGSLSWIYQLVYRCFNPCSLGCCSESTLGETDR